MLFSKKKKYVFFSSLHVGCSSIEIPQFEKKSEAKKKKLHLSKCFVGKCWHTHSYSIHFDDIFDRYSTVFPTKHLIFFFHFICLRKGCLLILSGWIFCCCFLDGIVFQLVFQSLDILSIVAPKEVSKTKEQKAHFYWMRIQSTLQQNQDHKV